jgi:chromosomal replication initiation ATPase DnaA
VITSNWTEREFAQYHSRIASRLKAAVHVHISAPDARGKVGRGGVL